MTENSMDKKTMASKTHLSKSPKQNVSDESHVTDNRVANESQGNVTYGITRVYDHNLTDTAKHKGRMYRAKDARNRISLYRTKNSTSGRECRTTLCIPQNCGKLRTGRAWSPKVNRLLNCVFVYLLYSSLLLWNQAFTDAACTICPTDCDCNDSSDQCFVDCGERIKNLPASADIDPLVKKLNLSGNGIELIPSGYFDAFSQLTELYLDHNKLTKMSKEDVDIPNLNNISLSFNNWTCNCQIAWLQMLLNGSDTSLGFTVIDSDNVLCGNPSSLKDQNIETANLSTVKCATSYVSCLRRSGADNTTVILWEYTNLESDIVDAISCREDCYNQGFVHATVHSAGGFCLCSSGETNTSESAACNSVCSQPSPATVCGREVVSDVVLSAYIDPKFSGIAVYSQHETVQLGVIPDMNVTVDYIWDFNDTTALVMTRKSEVTHKYGLAGTYFVSVTVSSDNIVQLFTYPIVVEEPITDVTLNCPSSVQLGEKPQITVDVKHGGSPRLEWTHTFDGVTTNDDTFVRDGAHFFEAKRTAYYADPANKLNLLSAKTSCEHGIGLLARIDSDNVTTFVMDNLLSSASEQMYWIGVVFDDHFGGTMFLITGESFTDSMYTNWGEGEPNLSDPNSRCAAMNASDGGKWYLMPCAKQLPFICQYRSPDHAEQPRHYIAGSTIFGSNSMYELTNLTESAPSAVPPGRKVYSLLFPGFWLHADGIVTNWEFGGSTTSYISMLKLQVFRPTCKSPTQLIRPGCQSLNNSYTTCGTSEQFNTCTRTIPNCSAGTQPCPIEDVSCKPVSEACSMYERYGFSDKPSPGTDLEYVLVSEQVVNAYVDSSSIYQVVVKNGQSVNMGDVIAVSFLHDEEDLTNMGQNDLPVYCQSSSRSSWRQNVLLVQGSDWLDSGSALDLTTTKWIDSMWCDIRMHYSTPATGFVPTTKFLQTPTIDGNHTYSVAAFNNVSLSDAAICVVQVRDDIKSVTLFYPEAVGTAADGYQIIDLSGSASGTVVLSIEGGGQNLTATWEGVASSTAHSKLRTTCPLGVARSECLGRTNLRLTTIDVDTTAGSSLIKATVSNGYSSKVLYIRTSTDDAITGLRILPEGISRVLASIPQAFSAEVDTGTSVSYTWVIDGLFHFRYTGREYNVVFRTAAEYVVTVTAENGVNSLNQTLTLSVETMNLLANLDFVNNPPIVQIDTTIELQATFLVDINIDYQAVWTINNQQIQGDVISQPHTGDPDPDPDTKRVYQIVAQNASFPTVGEKSVELSIRNDYDSISKTITVDIRSPFDGIIIEMISDVPAVGDALQFRVTGSPSTYGATFLYEWSDGTNDPATDQATVTHTFSSPGTYVINVTADNQINAVSNYTTITVYERITGLTVVSSGPTELSLSTIISASIATSVDDAVFTFDFDDGSIPTVVNSTNTNQTITYTSSGRYNVSVTAKNMISTQTEFIEVHVFELKIESVNTTEACYRSNTNATMQVFMTTETSVLYDFKWTFEDGSDQTIELNGVLNHVFTTPAQHVVQVEAISRNTSLSDQMNVTVCVQDAIATASISDAPATILGTETNFTLASTGGTDPTYDIDFGDGTSSSSVTLPEVKHTYSSIGNYTVVFTAENLVSEINDTVYLVVQEEVLGVNIITSSEYEPFIAMDFNFTYTATTTSGTDLSYEWDFGDGTVIENGNNVTHAFTSGGTYTITVTVSNLVSSRDATLNVTVEEPVSGTTISHPVVVKANTTVTLTASIDNGTPGESYYWKVEPDQSTYNLVTSSLTYVFTQVYNYTVSVKVENRVSADYDEVYILAADPIQGVNISTTALVDDKYVPRNESTRFEAILETGENVTLTTAGSESVILSDWTVSIDGVVEETYNDSASIYHTFEQVGVYIVVVNISNGVSAKSNEIEVHCLDRVGEINFEVIDGHQGAATSGEEVIIMASADVGTDLHYYWNPDDGSSYIATNDANLTYTYTTVNMYYPFVVVGNVLGNETASYTLAVQDGVTGLSITQPNARVEFYAGEGQSTTFESVIATGTNVSYSWHYIDSIATLTDVENSTKTQVSFQFPTVGVYTLIVNASNMVSWTQVDETVTVITPISGLDIVADSFIVAINDSIQLNGTITAGDGVDFTFSVDGQLFTPVVDRDDLAYVTRAFASAGTYEVVVTASNNVSSDNITKSISVRERIESVKIQGCCSDGQYLATNENYDFTANVTSGTDVVLSWTITYEDGQILQDSGTDISKLLTVAGVTEITVTASNGVSDHSDRIVILLQDQCVVTLSVDDPGRSLYTNEEVTLRMNVVQGTNVSHSISWGDFPNTVDVTRENFATHIYRFKGDYTITVNSSNEVSSIIRTEDVTILKLECVAPSVSFVQSSLSSNFLRSRTIYVESTLTSNCSAYEVSYQWRVYKQTDCTTLDSANLQVISFNTNKPMLVLPALTLEVSRYCFEVTVSYADTSLSDQNALSAAVISTPLTVVIIGGTTRFLSQSLPLTLDATFSFDPDVPDQNSNGISYQWSCNSTTALTETEYGYVPIPAGSKTGGVCDIPTGFSTASSFVVPAGTLTQGTQYDYIVEASKTAKTPTTSIQTVVVIDRLIPTTTVVCFSCRAMASYQISASFHVGLRGSCDSCTSTDEVSYLWEIKKIEDDGTLTDFPTDLVTTTTGDQSQHLVVKEGALENAHAYEFKLRIIVDGVEGYSKLELQPNMPPVNGTCEMTYNNGQGGDIYVLETLVSFSCSNWEDDATDTASPLVYTIIAYRSTNADTEDLNDAFILYRGTKESSHSYLPFGYAEYNYVINVQIYVEDQLGTSTLAIDENVTVRQGPIANTTVSWLLGKVNDELNTLVRLNDPQQILDFSAAVITVLNSESTVGAPVSTNSYSESVSVREAVTQTVSEITATTLKEVQQIASVLEHCVKFPSEMQNPSMHGYVQTSVSRMISQLSEFVNKEGHSSFQRATNDVLDIIGGMMRVVNFAVYDKVTATEIATIFPNASVNFDESYRKGIVTNLNSNINSLVTNLLESKVVDEEAVSFLSPVISLSTKKTTPLTALKQQVSGGVQWQLPDHIFDSLDPNMELQVVSIVHEQNPYTFGYPAHGLGENGFVNITSRVPTIEFYDAGGTAISISNLASTSDGDERRVKLAMSQSSWEYINSEDTVNTIDSSGSQYRPRTGLTFDTISTPLQPLQTFGITLTNNNRDVNTGVNIMLVYTKKYNNNKGESNPAVEVYLGYAPNPNAGNHTVMLRITDAEMADGVDHQLYTFFLDPRLNDTTVPQIYLNVSNYFNYEILDLQIGVYYSLCMYYRNSTEVWATDGVYVSGESTYSVTVCYSDHLTSFGSFVINPPNLVNLTNIVNIDFSQNPFALITVVIIMFFYILAMIWARRLDLRDVKRASLIPLCGPNGSFKYEITIKTSAGMGSGTTANVGICLYGADGRSGSRHLVRKDAFQRGAVDTMQIATDINLGEIFKIKIWHDNTGLDPGWNVDRIMVRDIQTGFKYYFLVSSWLQVYPDDEDEACLERTVEVATEEELTNFSNIFGSQLSYGWEDAHLWLSVIERPTRSRFTRVQRVTCCFTLLLLFMVLSAMWYQGYDPNGEIEPQDTIIGLIRWQDIAVGAIVSLMVFPASLLLICMFKKSKSSVSPVKPWLERSQTAQTIEILDEILDGGDRQYIDDVTDSEDEDFDGRSKQNRSILPGHSEFLAEFHNEYADGGSLFQSRSQSPGSRKSRSHESSTSQRSRLHKGSGRLKSFDIKGKMGSKVWSDDSAIQLSDSPSTSGATGSSGISLEDNESPDEWPNRTNATKSGSLHYQNEVQKSKKFSSTSFVDSPKSSRKLKRKQTGYAKKESGGVSPPNFIADENDDSDDLWDILKDDDLGDDLVITNKQAILKRTRRTKFSGADEILLADERQGLVDDDIPSDSEGDDTDSDVPLPEFPSSRGQSRMSRASTHFGTSPQPSSESCLLPHCCIYFTYLLCFCAMAVCIFFIILYGNDFGPDTTKRWLLTLIVSLLESFFLVEPIKVVIFAVLIAMISKPINPEENDNLVDKPYVDPYGHTDSFSKVRAPGGFALDKCKREAHKTQRSNKMLLNLGIYLIFLSSVAAVASWDQDPMGYHNTVAIKESLFETNFNISSDAEGSKWQNDTTVFKDISTITDIWEWMTQVLVVKLLEDKSSLENQNVNNNLLGKIRLRQQRGLTGDCIIDSTGLYYNQLSYAGKRCLTNDAGNQDKATYDPNWASNTFGSWNFANGDISGILYWGHEHMYDDSGYSQFIDVTTSVAEAQGNLTLLQEQNWLNRDTRVLFVEFTQLNEATYWFTVCVVMFEIGVSGAVQPSHNIQTVRIFVPSTSFYIDMLFMGFIGLIGLYLILHELNKTRDPTMSVEKYFAKWTNWLNLLVILFTIALAVLYIYKQIYMDEIAKQYISDKTAFTNFFKIAFFTDLVTIFACLLLFLLILRATRAFRFFKSWSAFGDTIAASAGYLAGATVILVAVILGFAALGFLVYGQSYTEIIPDFCDFPNAIYTMFRAFRGRFDVRICFDYSPFFTILFFFSYYLCVFYIFCKLFAAILINEYKFSRGRKSHLRLEILDYEILDHLIARIKLRLGIIKPKEYRPTVRFEGMSTPSSRGSFMSLDSFDTFSFFPGRISQCSYATGISSSSSDSGFGTPSDHSISVYDYLTLDQPSDTPMDTQHLDYLYGRLSNYSVDMMLHRFERVSVLTDEVSEMESNAVKLSIIKKQQALLQSQSKEIAAAASSVTVQPNYIPDLERQRSQGSATTYSSRGHFSIHSQSTPPQSRSTGTSTGKSGRKSNASSDALFETVMHSMFPVKHSWVSDLSNPKLSSIKREPSRKSSFTTQSRGEADSLKRAPVRQNSFTGLSHAESESGKREIARHNSFTSQSRGDSDVMKRVLDRQNSFSNQSLKKIHPRSLLRPTNSASAVLRRDGSNISGFKATLPENSASTKPRPHSDEGARAKNNNKSQVLRPRRTIISAFRDTPLTNRKSKM